MESFERLLARHSSNLELLPTNPTSATSTCSTALRQQRVSAALERERACLFSDEDDDGRPGLTRFMVRIGTSMYR